MFQTFSKEKQPPVLSKKNILSYLESIYGKHGGNIMTLHYQSTREAIIQGHSLFYKMVLPGEVPWRK